MRASRTNAQLLDIRTYPIGRFGMMSAMKESLGSTGRTGVAMPVAAALCACLLFLPRAVLAEEWGMALDDDEEWAEHEDEGTVDTSTGAVEDDDFGLKAPETPPEYLGARVEPEPGSPSALVVIVGADAVAERFAVDLERVFSARIERRKTLSPASPNDVLLAGEGSDPEVRLMQARAHASRGLEQYNMMELDEAIESFHDAIHRYGQAMAGLFDPVEMANAYLMLGATHFVGGNRQQAQEAFRQTLILDPGHEPDRAFFSPPLLDAFDGAKWEIGAMQAGSMTITATPAHAEVWVNGRFRGMAPLTLTDLPVGTVFVMARQRGFVPRVEVAVTLPGEPLGLEMGLRAGAGTGIYTSYRDAAVADMDSAGLRMPESVGRIAEMFSVDRVVIGRVRSDGSGRTAEMLAYDVGVGIQMAEARFDLLELEPAALVVAVDRFLNVAAGPAPDPLPEEAVRPPRKPLVLPAPADDWRFWAATGAGVAVIAGGVALFAALSNGESPPPGPTSHWPVIRIPPP